MNNEYIVTFDAGGGYIPESTSSIVEIRVKSGESIVKIPEPQMLDSYFGGWYTKKDGAGDLFDSSTIITSNMTVFAKWISHEFGNGLNFDEEKFMSEWNSWNNQNIKNYSFILHGGTGSFNNLIMPLDAHPPFSFKIIVLDGVMDSFEIIINGGVNPPFTTISHMYQRIFDEIQATRKWFNEGGNEVINSITINIGYGSMHYIAFYGKSYDYKEGHEVSENGLSYGVSDFIAWDN
jgi:hypothetical protein